MEQRAMTHSKYIDEGLNLSPMDDYNQLLVEHLHPQDWNNPQPRDRYDLVVIGAGPAGLVVAAGAAGLGAKVALVERHLMGGDCLNVGCVPSKCVIRSARVMGQIARAAEYGIQAQGVVDFPAVMARMRRLRAGLSHHDSVQRFQHKLGIDVFLGAGQFHTADTVQVAGQTLRFRKAVVATGARAAVPTIPGLATVGYLTNETVFNLTDRPNRLAVIGAGPIGCELAQSFRRLGCDVTLFHKHGHILDREDTDAAEIVQQQLLNEGIHLVFNTQFHQVERTDGGITIHYETGGQISTAIVDQILVGAGRAPNVEGLNLDAVNVDYTPQLGIRTNDYLQTSNPRIYAAGDCCMDWKFTHAADAAARIVIKNTLFSPFGLGRYKLSSLVMPWVTYTDPEIAHVGLSETQAQSQGQPVQTFKVPFTSLDRAVCDSETEGFAKIHVQKGTDVILGATIVASHAGDMINEITLAMVHKLGLGKLSSVIHPYPTQAEAIRKAADAYRRTLLTPRTEAFLKLLMGLPS
jgi:pyruvate/2-oxoglutarate dehydrogenase complex dihydrolipoamide dehydrogenase (E3) component